MSGTPAAIKIQNEKLEAAQEWLHQNGDNLGGIEFTPAVGDAEDGYTAHTMTVRRKAKKNEDGPLEIICGWIFQHQIGMLSTQFLQLVKKGKERNTANKFLKVFLSTS